MAFEKPVAASEVYLRLYTCNEIRLIIYAER